MDRVDGGLVRLLKLRGVLLEVGAEFRERRLLHGRQALRFVDVADGDELLPQLRRDPEWPHKERSVNRRNDRHREEMIEYIRTVLRGRARDIHDHREHRVVADHAEEIDDATFAKLRDGAWGSPYHLRKVMVEPVFGQIKQARGFRQFLMRGLANVQAEWAMVCTAHNLCKLAAAR